MKHRILNGTTLSRVAFAFLLIFVTSCGDVTVGDGSGASSEPRPLVGDGDGDGVPDAIEVAGWDIVLEDAGLGLPESAPIPRIVTRHVTSNPLVLDSDGDGLDDGEEYVIRSDPSRADSDGDGLDDHAEWVQWFTSPISVDSDGDARGPGSPGNPGTAPNAALFDGAELAIGLSPTLADTDGDGKTDWQELGHPFRSPLIADLPKVEIDPVGDIDVRLHVEYSDAMGVQESFGTTLSTTSQEGTSNSSMQTTQSHFNHSHTVATTVSGGVMFELNPFKLVGGKAGVSVTNSNTVDYGTSTSNSNALQTSSSRAATSESSRVLTNSRTRTETASSGEIHLGMRVRNVGDAISFRLTNLGMTVLQKMPGDTPDQPASFRTVGTLRPDLPAVTLPPGGTSGILTVSAEGVNADLVRQFLANPSGLSLEPSYFDLENEEGINYAFLAENTYSQTALVEFDFGTGRVERYRVATNVDRTPTGQLKGVLLTRALEIIGKPFQTELTTYTPDTGCDPVTEVRLTMLDGVREFLTAPPAGTGGFNRGNPEIQRIGYWTYATNTASENGFLPSRVCQPTCGGVGVDFDQIRLHAGDEIRLVYVIDEDGDGLSKVLERAYGTLDEPPTTSQPSPTIDTDGDGVGDLIEPLGGWAAGVPLDLATSLGLTPCNFDGFLVDLANEQLPLTAADRKRILLLRGPDNQIMYPRWVYSNPTLMDTDGDGCDDGMERENGTDPTNPDTDEDGLPDCDDPLPLKPALVMHVDRSIQTSGDGSDWQHAVKYLRDAIAMARATLINNSDPQDDIGQIWVRQGTYYPHEALNAADRPGAAEDAYFLLPSDIAILGGFDGTEQFTEQRNPDPATNGTTLSGYIGSPVAPAPGQSPQVFGSTGEEHSLHVVVCAAGSRSLRLDGFSILGGRATTLADPAGGGLTVEATPPQNKPVSFANLLFRDNEAYVGGAVYDGSWARFEGCTFSQNRVIARPTLEISNIGPGFFVTTITTAVGHGLSTGSLARVDSSLAFPPIHGTYEVTVTSPTEFTIPHVVLWVLASPGGGSLGTVKNACVTVGLHRGGPSGSTLSALVTPAGNGGAVWAWDSDSIYMGCAFSTNEADGSGGALHLEEATMLVEASSFDANRALSGGAVSNGAGTLRLSRCAFERNSTAPELDPRFPFPQVLDPNADLPFEAFVREVEFISDPMGKHSRVDNNEIRIGRMDAGVDRTWRTWIFDDLTSTELDDNDTEKDDANYPTSVAGYGRGEEVYGAAYVNDTRLAIIGSHVVYYVFGAPQWEDQFVAWDFPADQNRSWRLSPAPGDRRFLYDDSVNAPNLHSSGVGQNLTLGLPVHQFLGVRIDRTGGAILNTKDLLATQCTFYANHAMAGAAVATYTSGDPTVDTSLVPAQCHLLSCSFSRNEAYIGAGAVYAPRGGRAPNKPDEPRAWTQSEGSVENCVFGGGAPPLLTTPEAPTGLQAERLMLEYGSGDMGRVDAGNLNFEVLSFAQVRFDGTKINGTNPNPEGDISARYGPLDTGSLASEVLFPHTFVPTNSDNNPLFQFQAWRNLNPYHSPPELRVDAETGFPVRHTWCRTLPTVGSGFLGLYGNVVAGENETPGFANEATGNLRLTSSSPLLDAGDRTIDWDPLTTSFEGTPATDFDGNPRVVRSFGTSARIDLGAFEYQFADE